MRLTKSIFLHIPKTGGQWVKESLRSSAKVVKEYKGHQYHVAHARDMEGMFKFTFIRHPLSWYQSYYVYASSHGWEEHWRIANHDLGINHLKSDNFNVFMDRVLEERPHFFSKVMNERIQIADYVGRQENLDSDLIKALRLADEPFDEDKICSMLRVNVSASVPEYSTYIRECVLKQESEFITKWYPNGDIT